MLMPPRITVEVPVLAIGSGPADYEQLGNHVDALRRPQGLHMTLLHLGVLADFARDIDEWTRGITPPERTVSTVVSWLMGLPVLHGFTARSTRLVLLGGGRVSGLEVEVPPQVRDFQVSLVKSLHELLDDLMVDNIDDFILGSRALGFRYPRWTPHVAVGRPKEKGPGPWDIGPLEIDFGESRIRNRQHLPGSGAENGRPHQAREFRPRDAGGGQ